MTDWQDAWDGAASHFERLPNPVLVIDGEGVVRRCTQPLAGRATSVVTDAALLELCEDADRAPLGAALAAARAGDASHIRVRLVPLPDESEPAALELALAPFGAARSTAVLAIATDITALALEQARLERRERLLVDTQDVAHFGVWEWDLRQPTAEWSEALYQIYGLDPSGHVPTYEDYLTRVHPDDRQRVIDATNGVFQRHEPYDHDERIFRTDGEMRYLHTWAHPVVNASGELVRLLGVCQDITARKKAEAESQQLQDRLAAVFEASPIGLATVVQSGEIIDASPALARLFGASPSALLGSPLSAHLHSQDAARYARFLAGAFASDGRSPRMRLRLKRDGGGAWVRVTAARLQMRGGRSHALLLFEDLSPEVQAKRADELATSRLMKIQELERDAEWKSTLLSVTSHEMKNPLSPMVLLVEMLQTGEYGPLTDEQSDAISLIGQQAERLSHLVRDILDVAKIERGGLRVVPRELDLGALVQRVARTFRPLARQWGVELGCETPDEPLLVEADPERTEQVIVNLLSNALEFTPEHGTVTLRVDAGPRAVAVSVEDTGPGLRPEDRDRLFQAFSQLGAERRAGHRGTGLGLFISKSLVDAHHGKIWVESEPGCGSKFVVELPVREPPRASAP